MNYKLEVDSVLLTYNNRIILSDIYLRVNTGDIVGLLGRNGSGKSCLLKIIFGLIDAENKSVRLDGIYKPALYKEKKAVKYLTQHPLFPKSISFAQAVDLFLENDQDKNEFLMIPEIVKLSDKPFMLMSSGEKRFVEVALFLFIDTKFLLLDEPFSNISPIQIEVVSEILLKKAKNKGIIITDHSYNYILDITTKNYFLRDGRMVKFDNKAELIKLGYIPE
jgi:ABC-type lipopolysaccharide export system ATPase subunit